MEGDGFITSVQFIFKKKHWSDLMLLHDANMIASKSILITLNKIFQDCDLT